MIIFAVRQLNSKQRIPAVWCQYMTALSSSILNIQNLSSSLDQVLNEWVLAPADDSIESEARVIDAIPGSAPYTGYPAPEPDAARADLLKGAWQAIEAVHSGA